MLSLGREGLNKDIFIRIFNTLSAHTRLVGSRSMGIRKNDDFTLWGAYRCLTTACSP